MAAISVRNASVEIPVSSLGGNSLKVSLLRKAVGGKFSQTGKNLTVSALRDINLEARDGTRIGLVGHNGAGKTTLLRLLAGVYPPTSGKVRVVGRISPMFDITLGMSPDATGIENIRVCGALWGLTEQEIKDGIDDIEEFTELGEYLRIPVRTYSAGMMLRLSFAIATLRRPEILLLDEVIGVGDSTFQAKAKERLNKIIDNSQIVVVSSHSVPIIKDLCDTCIWLEKGQIAGQGSVDDVLRAYHESILAGSAADHSLQTGDAMLPPD